ncbi:hypothetical protein LS70_009190 [Helicobacter sp. MIT 11-5569]|uniref:AAA family ATPase n=1 Tax=Helicobacter sp. MIT 11-5569 TaxID=1548151 RepID=UPI00068DC550|nr:AAA family ATPase [Helicobacter sp. MIT 11-5569]TLD80345.1 hypothetical protein LS70_009190 [Helicobacter sp. MIT 11-5569]
MYVKQIIIKNIGGIESLEINPSFTDEGKPRPVVIVGENGRGKTLLLSNIMDSFYEISSSLFDNISKINNLSRRFYKINESINLKEGSKSGFTLIKYKSSKTKSHIEYIDYINCNANEIKDICSLLLQTKIGKKITEFTNNEIEKLRREWLTQAHYYQPAYRYEEPFRENSNFNSGFKDEIDYREQYSKELEIITSLNKNHSYIMNILDTTPYTDKKDDTWEAINTILREVKQNKNLRFRIVTRNSNAQIGIYENNRLLLSNINQLSLGELLLLNLFTNIVRHTDLSGKPIELLEGIVVIDKIDAHLHDNLQSKILPRLIKLFPKIQFIVTSHSSLFVLGMEREFGNNGFDLIEMSNR